MFEDCNNVNSSAAMLRDLEAKPWSGGGNVGFCGVNTPLSHIFIRGPTVINFMESHSLPLILSDTARVSETIYEILHTKMEAWLPVDEGEDSR